MKYDGCVVRMEFEWNEKLGLGNCADTEGVLFGYRERLMLQVCWGV